MTQAKCNLKDKKMKLSQLLFLITTCLVIAVPKAVNAQWVPIGESEDGVKQWVSKNYWILNSYPNIRIYHFQASSMSGENSRRGVLGAVNCATGAFTFKVSGNGQKFKVSPNDYEALLNKE